MMTWTCYAAAIDECSLAQTDASIHVIAACRVHTMAIPVVQDLAEMYRECDPAASMNLLARLAVEKSLNSKLDDCRLGLQVGVNAVCRQV